MRVVDILVDERVFKHFSSAQFDEQMSGHVIGQISQHDGSPSCFFHCATIDFVEVESAIYIYCTVLVVQNRCGWLNAAILLSKVE